jgi:hypothetical protein
MTTTSISCTSIFGIEIGVSMLTGAVFEPVLFAMWSSRFRCDRLWCARAVGRAWRREAGAELVVTTSRRSEIARNVNGPVAVQAISQRGKHDDASGPRIAEKEARP